MSRGRGGTPREHHHRHSPPHLQAKDKNHSPGPASLYQRPGPQQTPFPNYYHNPAGPIVPLQPSAPSHIPSSPPTSNHSQRAPDPAAPNSLYNPNHCPPPGPSSFQYQQVAFLRGQSSEAPQFRASQCGGGRGVVPGRVHNSSYHLQSGYSRYPKPNSSPCGRGVYGQDQYVSSVRDSRYLHQNQFQERKHNRFYKRQGIHTDSLSGSFQRLTFYQDRPNRGERFDRHSVSSHSANLSCTKVNITLTPDIQDKVHRVLVALKPSESISAKLLAKKLHQPKKIVNKALYSLKRSQKASKQGLLPPEWTVYREPLRDEGDQNSTVQSPPPLLFVNSEQPPEAKSELKIKTEESLGEDENKNSDRESSSLNCSSLESSDSEESQATAKGQDSSTSSSSDQELCIMPEQKELILQYLLNSGEVTALVLAKNLGFKTAKQVNPTLYCLEKQGDVVKNGKGNPPTWALSSHRRERMERSLKAARSTPSERGQMEVEVSGDDGGGGSIFLPSSSLPSIPGLEPLPLQGNWMSEQSDIEGVRKYF